MASRGPLSCIQHAASSLTLRNFSLDLCATHRSVGGCSTRDFPNREVDKRICLDLMKPDIGMLPTELATIDRRLFGRSMPHMALEMADVDAVSKLRRPAGAKTPCRVVLARIDFVSMYLQATFFGCHPHRHKRIMPTQAELP
jgi:hypothetical protein